MASYSYTFTSGDSVTPTKLNSARTVSDIVNADIKSDAAIAGTKIAPNFGSQNIQTTGSITANGSKLVTTRPNATASTAAGCLELQIDGVSHASVSTANSNTMLLHTGGSERVRIDASGNVGIGYNSPSTINTANSSANLVVGSGSGSEGVTIYSGNASNDFGALNFADGTSGDATYRGIVAYRHDLDALQLFSAATERMRIDSSGNLLVSRTTTAAGNSGWYFGPSGIARGEFNGGQVFVLNRIDVDGTVIGFHRAGVQVGEISVTTTATTYSTSSDYRLKENAAPLTGGLSTVSQLNPVSFKWKSDGSTGYGFIAHELQAVVPEAVTGEKDAVDAEGKPQYQGVDASKLVPYLVAAVQELSARVEALEAAQ